MKERNSELDAIFSLVYEELKRLAAHVRRNQTDQTLNTTALVHEAWLKLQNSVSIRFESDAHFKAIASTAMRQVLVDAARRRNATKRSAGLYIQASETEIAIAPATDEEVIALEAALIELEKMNPRQSKVVECRFYGSMTVEDTARVLGVSASVVERDWRAARAWLAARLAGGRDQVT